MPKDKIITKKFARLRINAYLCQQLKSFSPMPTDEKTILQIKDIARAAVPSGSKAILFGSRARGDARQDSDWDILILLDKEHLEQTDYDKVSYPFVLLGCDLGTEINPILYTKKEWDSYSFTPFYKNVQKDGISLV